VGNERAARAAETAIPTVLLQVGFAWPAPFGAAGALLPHHFTLATRRGGMFLWHFPSSRLDQPLAGTRARWSPDFPRPADAGRDRPARSAV